MALAYNSDFPNVIEHDMVINNMNIRNYSVTHHKQPALPPRQTLLQRRDLRHA